MKNGSLLGLVLLAAFVAFCFTRDPERRAPVPPRARRGARGDGSPRETMPGVIPPAHLHEGDPSVRH
ncbi:MAG TPA: hypothetical protein VN782_11450 [Usitatibacter sp.]|nr:hypothetical protein [Usitatibacter sp.]